MYNFKYLRVTKILLYILVDMYKVHNTTCLSFKAYFCSYFSEVFTIKVKQLW